MEKGKIEKFFSSKRYLKSFTTDSSYDIDKCLIWYYTNLYCHRKTGPSEIYFLKNKDIVYKWFRKSIPYRTNGPYYFILKDQNKINPQWSFNEEWPIKEETYWNK